VCRRALPVFEDLPFVVAQENAVGIAAENVVGVDGYLAAAAGASMTYCGTAYPVVWPRRLSITSRPRRTLARKWADPAIRSHW